MKKAGAKSYDVAAKKMRPLCATGAGKEVLRLSCGGMWSCRPTEETAPVLHCEKQRQFCAKILRFAQKHLSCRNENPRHNILCLGFFQRFRSETCVLFCLRSQENAGKTTVEPLLRQGNFSLQSSAVLGILKNMVGNCGEIIHIGGAKSHTRPQNDHGVVKT